MARRDRRPGGGFARALLVGVLALAGFVAAPAQAIRFDVGLDPAQEVPSPNVTGFTPSGSATVDVNTITGDVNVSGSYAGMTSNVGAAHLHGPAPPGVAAGVLFGFSVSGGTGGTFNATSTLSATNLTDLLAGQTYVNVHTVNNGPGEIRGQVVDSDIRVFDILLDTSQEVPTPAVSGFTPAGMARVVVDTSSGDVEIAGSYSGMTSNVAAAHLHGPAAPGSAAGVIFGVSVSGGTSGTFSGSSTLSAPDLASLLAGQTYVNVHTVNNVPGEIRGQVVPEPGTLLLLGVGLGAWVVLRRRHGVLPGRLAVHR